MSCFSCSCTNVVEDHAKEFDAVVQTPHVAVATTFAPGPVSRPLAPKAPPATSSRRRALLFGLNYQHCKLGRLQGCINDVRDVESYLTSRGFDCRVFTDDVHRPETSGRGIIQNIYKLALETWADKLETVWIHYSGHGGFVPDTSRDEADSQDECLVPSDYETSGVVLDDTVNSVLRLFNPATKVILVFDCCHSGTIADLKYRANNIYDFKCENRSSSIPANVIALSGCMDDQTSADAWNPGKSKFQGALTACLMDVLRTKPTTAANVFDLLREVRASLLHKGYAQMPLVTSSYNLLTSPVFI